jgi:hypothetical protein
MNTLGATSVYLSMISKIAGNLIYLDCDIFRQCQKSLSTLHTVLQPTVTKLSRQIASFAAHKSKKNI